MKQPTNLNQAIQMLTTLVTFAESSTDIKVINFNRVAASERPAYEAALQMANDAIKAGEITRVDFLRRVGID